MNSDNAEKRERIRRKIRASASSSPACVLPPNNTIRLPSAGSFALIVFRRSPVSYLILPVQLMRPDSPVLMAAYGDYGPGYIGTAVAYTQGGYEVGPVSRVAPEAEDVLTGGMRELLK